MSAQNAIEAVIAAASALKDAASALQSAYAKLPPVIEREHAAIRARELLAMEQAADAKAQVGSEIEARFAALFTAAGGLAALKHRLFTGGEGPAPRLAALKDAVAALRELESAFLAEAGMEPMALGVLSHQVEGLAKLAHDFEAQMRVIKPLIEGNRHLVQSMLENYQDSYRFWTRVAEETALSYNSQGLQKAEGRLSGFRVRA